MKIKSKVSFPAKVMLLSAWAAILSSALFTSCSDKPVKNGWYPIRDCKTQTFDSSPIVTTADFEVLRIDSALNSANVMTYMITGKIKSDKAKVWADATEKGHRQTYGFSFTMGSRNRSASQCPYRKREFSDNP